MIYANIATIPEREEMLKKVIDSIYDQFDYIFIALNGYEHLPNCVMREKIFYSWTKNELGDAHKFMDVETQKGYIFTMDDDLIYPPDYVEIMIENIEQYKRGVIVTMHGRNFGRFPIKTYYREPSRKVYRCLGDVEKDIIVQVGGTGVMAWHSDTIQINYKDIKLANMADIWMAVFAREKYVPIMCLAHKEGYIQYLGPLDDSPENPQTIWAESFNNDKQQTDLFNGRL